MSIIRRSSKLVSIIIYLPKTRMGVIDAQNYNWNLKFICLRSIDCHNKHVKVLESIEELVISFMTSSFLRKMLGRGWGDCREKVHVPSSKTYVTFQGSGRHNTIITWDDNANKTGSTFTSASVAVHADHFIAQYISFEVTI